MPADIKPSDIGLGRDAQSPQDAEQRTRKYLSNSTLYPNGRLKMTGKKEVIKQRFEDFRNNAKGVAPPWNLVLVQQLHIAEDRRFWLIGRRDSFDQVQYINPKGKECDGHAGMSMIHIMGIPRNDVRINGKPTQEPIYNGVSMHSKNVGILDHMKRKFQFWWEKDPIGQARHNVIWHQARTVIWKFMYDLEAHGKGDGVDAQTRAQNLKKGIKGQYESCHDTLMKAKDLQERNCISTDTLRYEDMQRWDMFLQTLVMWVRGRQNVIKDRLVNTELLGWQHPTNRLLKAHEHYMLLKKSFEEKAIRFEDFDFALHLRPDNSVDYLHMHIFLSPNRYRLYSCVIWDPLYKAVDEVAEIAKQYPGPVGPKTITANTQEQQTDEQPRTVRVSPSNRIQANTKQTGAKATTAGAQKQQQKDSSGTNHQQSRMKTVAPKVLQLT
ncbi:hypothetical protein VMCG_05577 [Cytospora schulzeri]|uniref:Uncharacterized protein n=1 Tax=Cytospora schulzeri TaxID=448051 RepID=A0A423WES2_9PEZI|nr:hypothetical protein VMCG_05577 [Valsa malicola]